MICTIKYDKKRLFIKKHLGDSYYLILLQGYYEG